MTNANQLAKIEDEAADWAVLLGDDPDDAELQCRFQVWLKASPVHGRVWEQTRRVSQGLAGLNASTQEQWPVKHGAHSEDGQVLSKQVEERGRAASLHACSQTPTSATGPAKLWLSSAQLVRRPSLAVGIAAMFCVLMLWPTLSQKLSADYTTGTGEQRTVQLSDGSRLFLAPESVVDVDITQDRRHVRLLQGSAYFEVARDPEHPFSVDAGGTRTTALGTAFNVDKQDAGTVVSVAHGKVRVDDRSIRPSVSQNLTAGDKLTVLWGGRAIRSETQPQEVAQWRRGELIARNVTVGDVVAAMRPYYHGVIIVTDPFAQQRITGLYRLDDPVSTLTDMAAAHNASATQISPWLLVLNQ